MDKETKAKVARKILNNMKLTKEQFNEIKLLIEEFDLEEADVQDWEDIGKELDSQFNMFYIL